MIIISAQKNISTSSEAWQSSGKLQTTGNEIIFELGIRNGDTIQYQVWKEI